AGQGMTGEGVLATVRFRAAAAGSPSLTIARVVGRDGANQPVTVTIGATRSLQRVGAATELKPALPNPSRGNSMLRYSLARRGPVDLSIFSVDGRRVRTLVSGVQEVGRYQLTWDGTDERGNAMRSGVFYIRFEGAGTRASRMITL